MSQPGGKTVQHKAGGKMFYGKGHEPLEAQKSEQEQGMVRAWFSKRKSPLTDSYLSAMTPAGRRAAAPAGTRTRTQLSAEEQRDLELLRTDWRLVKGLYA